MGNFTGHMDEAIVFYLLCLWWMYKGFTNYIKASLGQGQYVMQMSYVGRIRGRKIYLEQALKIIFPLAAVIGELIASHMRFRDENGQAAGVKYLMHITIFGLFCLHGIVDLLVKLKVPWVHPKMDLFSGAVAFLWYGMGLYYHVQPTKSEIENSLHLLLAKPIFLMSITLMVAIIWPKYFLLDFVRCYCISLMATWTTHIAFLLYKPGFLGMEWNPNLYFYHTGNRHYIPAAFGLHVGFNLTFMFVFYALCYCFVTRTNCRQNIEYSICKDEEDGYSERLIADDNSNV